MLPRRATVIGVFADQSHAWDAVNELRQAGFRDDQIGLMVRDGSSMTTSHPVAHEQQREKAGLQNDLTKTRWEEGTGIGAAAGAVTGTGLALAVAAGLMTGVGPVIAGGTLMAILASAGTGAVVGSILGGLVGLGVPEEEARYYEGEVTGGRTIVTVRADDRAPQAWDILARHGAYDYENRAAAPGAGLAATPY